MNNVARSSDVDIESREIMSQTPLTANSQVRPVANLVARTHLIWLDILKGS